MPTATPPDLQPLVAAQGQTRVSLTDQAMAIAAESARGFTEWYSADQITTWAAGLVKLLDPILWVLAVNTDAYMAQAVTDIAGRRLRPVGPVDASQLRRGITQAGAYARAADAYRWQQHQYDQIARLVTTDLPKAESMLGLVTPGQAAIERVQAVANTDTQLVVRAQAQRTMQAGEDKGLVTGWRRVIHPELAINGTCGLCVAASDRIYKVSDLQPIHRRCNCVPAPILDGRDPGSLLNTADLNRLYKDAGSTGAKDLKRTRYQVSDHSELGPVLNDGTFRTPRRVRESTRQNVQPKTPAERRQAVERIHRDLTVILPTLQDLAHESPKQWGAYVQQMQHRVAELEHELAA